MFVLLIFCGQQGYIFKDYKKVTNKLANSDETAKKVTKKDIFTFTAVCQDNSQRR
jgi:general secretion pathway protein C